jgi:hypothetical protein
MGAPTRAAVARGWTAPGRRARQRSIIVSVCWIGKQSSSPAVQQSKETVVALSVPPSSSFFLGLDIALARLANHDVHLPKRRAMPNMQAPATCFTRSAARDGRATQPEESSAAVTPLAVVYSSRTAAATHSARPVLYLQLLGDESSDSVGPKEPEHTMGTVTRCTRAADYEGRCARSFSWGLCLFISSLRLSRTAISHSLLAS